jgi:hypothetical protein
MIVSSAGLSSACFSALERHGDASVGFENKQFLKGFQASPAA